MAQFERWVARFADFRDQVRHAEASAEVRVVGVLVEAIQQGDTNAAKFWLERRRGDDWGLKQRLEVSLRTEAERIATEQGLDPDELVKEAERIASGRG